MTDNNKAPPLVNVQIKPATREALAAVRADMRKHAKRPVTFDEALRDLIDLWNFNEQAAIK